MAETRWKSADPFELISEILANIATVMRGKERETQLVLTAMLAGGHVLLEDVPGTAKTVLSRAFQQSIKGATHSRIQGTPDLQPDGITGLSVYDQKIKDFTFHPGPVFANILLVDEINRTTPKTQSALLEAMAERQITVDGVQHMLNAPFFVMATENPLESQGTYPLPEAQIDRFLIKMTIGYPEDWQDEVQILADQVNGHPLGRLAPVITKEEVLYIQEKVKDVEFHPNLREWVVHFVRATRTVAEPLKHRGHVGASVRGSLNLERAARAWALIQGRDYVTFPDLELLYPYVLGHRIIGPKPGKELEEFFEQCFELAPKPEQQFEAEIFRRR